jgi:phosphoglycerol transferase MdoB-like AlkP superfamily enzyme
VARPAEVYSAEVNEPVRIQERSWVNRSGIPRLLLPLTTIVVLHLESLWVHYELLGNRSPVEEPSPQHCLLLVILAVLSLMPRRLAAISGFLLTSVVTAIWIIDASYYRFFRELPSWHLLPTWRQAGKASESLNSVLQPTDAALLLGPFLLLILVLVGWRWSAKKPAPGWAAPVSIALLALAACLYSVQALPEVRWVQFKRRFQNVAMARVFGPLYYHAYDTYEVGRVALGREGGQNLDPAKVKAEIQKSRALSTQKTPFQGMFEGRDLIMIQMESLEYYGLEAEVDGLPVMPFMQKMAQVGYGFRLFDQTHLGRSADGQFIYLNSLHPPAERPLAFTYPNNGFVALPKMFAEKGYETAYLHPSDPSFWNSKLMAGAYGFETLLFRSELPARDIGKEIRGWGLTDQALFSRLIERTKGLDSQPFFAYVVTMMCHHPYPETKPEDTDFPPPDALSMVRRYLRCCNVRDRALEGLVRDLGKTERGRRSVLCLVGDHDSNVSNPEKVRLGLPAYPESEAVPLVICTVESALSEKPMLNGQRPPTDFGAQMDVAPSLGHVFSLAMEKSVFLGWNLFAKQKGGPRISRLGTWMDRRGMIKPPEDTSAALDTTEFEVSEMLLQSNRIPEFRDSL